MKLEIFKSLWGMSGSLEQEFERIKEAGYDGIECAAQEIVEPERFRRLLEQYQFKFIALVYTEGVDHNKHFSEVVDTAMQFDPVKIVAHGGRDTMSYVKQIRFFEHALRVEDSCGVQIGHETHRRRPFYTPMNAVPLLRELPELKINIDYSHWCCVTESMLEDHIDAIRITTAHSIHLHGRIGYENGPQVPDPRVAEWKRCAKRHEEWWEQIIHSQKERGHKTFTFTPEYGPATYMHTTPLTGEPTADLWDICLWGKERFKKQFDATMKQGPGM
jgi:sugar phosphate isomerase/epimerase